MKPFFQCVKWRQIKPVDYLSRWLASGQPPFSSKKQRLTDFSVSLMLYGARGGNAIAPLRLCGDEEILLRISGWKGMARDTRASVRSNPTYAHCVRSGGFSSPLVRWM